jgi:hypothetical protein
MFGAHHGPGTDSGISAETVAFDAETIV